MTRTAVFFAIALFLSAGANAAAHEDHSNHQKEAAKAQEQEVEEKPARVDLADVELVDQDGRKVKFAGDVVRGRVVVIDFIYTTCPLVCPILSAIFSRLQEQLGDRLGKEVFLVSVTVDPNTDIPPRLKEYAAKFEARPGWTFLTGEKQNVTQVLKGLGGYTADLTKHPAMILVGDGGKDRWTRFYGFPSPERILEKVNELAAARRTEKGNAEGHHGHGAGTNPGKSSGAASRPAMGIPADDAGRRAYFTDLPLITQDNRQVKFYTDVLKDKVVLVSFIFTSCDEACPLLMQSFHEVQRLLGDRAGKEVFLVSISLDPETDTPEALKAYGERYRAGPGWTFLTGGKKNLDWVVYKLGQYRADIENHSTLFLLGDVKNGRWRKIPGSTPPEAIVMDIDTLFLKR